MHCAVQRAISVSLVKSSESLAPLLDARILFSMSVVEGMVVLALLEKIWRDSGAVLRIAPFWVENVAQFLTNCATAHRSR
ncbi:hypothetical protein D3C76_947810 [compost metagenome]